MLCLRSSPDMCLCMSCFFSIERCCDGDGLWLKKRLVRGMLLTANVVALLQSALDAADLGSQDPDVSPCIPSLLPWFASFMLSDVALLALSRSWGSL